MPETAPWEDFAPVAVEDSDGPWNDFAPIDRTAKRKQLEKEMAEARQVPFGQRLLNTAAWAGQLLDYPLHVAKDPIGKTVEAVEGVVEAGASGIAGKPLEILPEYKPSVQMRQPLFGNIPEVPKQQGAVKQLGAGIVNAGIGFLNFFQTPEGIATLGIGGLPEGAKRTALAVIGEQMAANAPDAYNAAMDAASKGDWQEASKHTANFLASSGLGAKLLSEGTPKTGVATDTMRLIPMPDEARIETFKQAQDEIQRSEPTIPAETPPIEPQPVVERAPETPQPEAVVKPTEQPLLTSATRSDNEIYVSFDITKKVPTAKELTDQFKALGHDVQFVQFEPNLISTSKGVVNFKGTGVDKEGRYSEKATKEGFNAAFGTSENIRERSAIEKAIPLEERFKRSLGAYTKMELAENEPSVAKTGVESPGPGAKQEFIGMGGAVPSEFVPQPKTIGIKNERVDLERQERGQEPIMGPQRQANQVTWEKAMAKIDADGGWQDRLIAELKDKPRTPSAEEIVALDHRYADLHNEYTKSIREGEQARADGRLQDVADAKNRTDFFERELTDLEQIARKVGTEWGRSGQMRQRLLKEDFTLAAMESKMRAAKGFEPLTETEHAEVKALSEKLQAAEAAAQEVSRKAEIRIADLENARAMAEARAAAASSYAPGVLAKAERFASFMDTKAKAAALRLRERFARTSAGVDPAILSDLGIIGAAKITRGIVEFGKWTDAMAKDVGEWFREHAKEAYAESQNVFNAELEGFGTGKADSKQVKAAVTDVASRVEKARQSLIEKEQKRKQPISMEEARAKAKVDMLKAEYNRKLDKIKYELKSGGEKAWMGFKEGLNLWRAIKTSWDVSAVFRQGAFIVLGHPFRGLKNLAPMFRALASKEITAAIDAQIQSRPNAPLYERAKLFLSPLESTKLSGMEEAFMSRLGAHIPGVAASSRAYTTFLNKLRADTFDAIHRDLVGKRAPTQVELEAIADYINVATGRGNLGKASAAAETLATVFFAPRLVASRFQLLAGQPLYRGSARTRYLIAKEYGKFLAGLAGVYALGNLAGASVETDPRSADFMKLRFGKSRVDPMAGLSQASVLISRLVSGETKNAKGKIMPIRGKVPFGQSTTTDIIARFLRSKLSPAIGTAVDVAEQKNVVGEPVTKESLAKSFLVPLAFDDVLKAMQDQGVERGTALAILSLFGMSLQVYDERRPKPK